VDRPASAGRSTKDHGGQHHWQWLVAVTTYVYKTLNYMRHNSLRSLVVMLVLLQLDFFEKFKA
jgi:hypothetical protein